MDQKLVSIRIDRRNAGMMTLEMEIGWRQRSM
jgi:hypothetical protein